MDDVYVVETASTGTKGFPKDRVVEIGICRIPAGAMTFESVFAERIETDPREIGKPALDRLELMHGMDPQNLYFGIPEDEAVDRVRDMLVGKTCASFDIQEVFGKFLCFQPWNLTHEAELLPSIKSRFHPDLRFMETEGNPIRHLYDKVLPDDPASVGEGNGAYECACMSAALFIHLRGQGLF